MAARKSSFKKAYLIEVILPGVTNPGTTATKIQIPDQPYLRGMKTYGLETFTADDCTKSPQQKTPISLAQAKLAYLTLYIVDPKIQQGVSAGTGEWIQGVPFVRLHNNQNAATDAFARLPFDMEGKYVDWSKSYITLGQAYGNITDVSFLILVNFDTD